MRNWKTNLGAALVGLGTAIMLIDPHWQKWGALVNAFGTFFGLLFAKDYDRTGVVKERTDRNGRDSRLLAVFFVVGIWLLCAGCSSLVTDQVETALDGTQRKTHVRAYTFFDGKSDLTKLRTTATDKSQGMSVAGLSQESSGTNAVALTETIVSAVVNAAVKAAKP